MIAILASSVATEHTAIIIFALLAIAFVVIISPCPGHAIARSAHHRDSRRGIE